MTRRNLELVEPLRAGEARGATDGTLLSVLDRAVTPMGGRLLRRWILAPLLDPQQIWRRQDSVAELVDAPSVRAALRERLGGLSDRERLAGKVGTGRAGPRDLLGLLRSLAQLPGVCDALAAAQAPLLAELGGELDPLADVHALLARGLADDPPLSVG